MAMRPAVSYIPCATSSREQTGNISTSTQFEEGNLLSESRDNAESSDEYDDDSIMPPIISKEEMDVIDSGDESEDEHMSTETQEEIRDSSKSHTNVNTRETRYKIRYCIKQRQMERKG